MAADANAAAAAPGEGPYTGFCVSAAGGRLLVDTVSPTARAAKVNFLVARCTVPVFASDTDAAIERLWGVFAREVVCVPVVVFEITGEPLASQPTSGDPNLHTALIAAVAALRSYQYGNSAPDLAKETADFGDIALANARRPA